MPTRRILVVDDELLACASLADFLQEAGYDTATAHDGLTALRMHAARPFDVCIVDMRMPGMDGAEVIWSMHQIAPQARYIIYTGSPQFALTPALEEIGLSERDVVRKPVADMRVFLALVHSP